MKVCVDGLVFENASQIGIWRVFYEVMRRTSDRIDYTLWIRNKLVAPVPPGVRVVCDFGRRRFSRLNIPAQFLTRWSKRHPSYRCRNAQVFHSTFFTPSPGPTPVVTVYDMIAEWQYPICPWAADQAIAKRTTLASAARVIAISQTTASDLVRYYPELRERVRVVPLAADHMPNAHVSPSGKHGKRVIFVGKRNEYKNFDVLLSAILCSTWPQDLNLYVVGSPLADIEQRHIAQLGLTKRVLECGHLSDTELSKLYNNSCCLVFPSLAEGFGIPVLEAQSAGCPAVVSDIPVFREVAGKEGALFVDPRSPERWANAVAAVGSPELRKRLIEAGYANVSRFSWDRTAELTARVYEEAASL